MKPLVSVIIPTANRPHYLPRAVSSALAGMGSDEVEVIVIPNGPDESWRDSLAPYRKNCALRVVSIMEANANIARNAGLVQAQGDYIRFLDDDDYLIPEGAIKQYELMQSSGADVVSGSIKLVDQRGRCCTIWHQPDTDDLHAAVLSPLRRCQPTAHVYRRSSLGNVRWNPITRSSQDVEWLFDLCASAEVSWQNSKEIVGVWQHHDGSRISCSQDTSTKQRLILPLIIRSYKLLQTSGRLSGERRKAVASGMWGCIHHAFFRDPLYWAKIARLAKSIDPDARPVQPMYNYFLMRQLDPLHVQWLMFPKRLFFHYGRQVWQ